MRFGYDDNGNLESVTPPGRPPHIFEYTEVDLNGEYDPPDLTGLPVDHTLYTFNFDRQLELVTRPDGETIDLEYDSVKGQLDFTVIPRGTIDYGYHPTSGLLNSITAPDGGTLTLSYDGSLPTSSTWAGTVAGSVTRTYDNHLRLETETAGGGETFRWTYDSDGLLASVGKDGGTAAEKLTVTGRDPETGLLTSTSIGVVTETWGYNPFGELASYEAQVSGSAVYSVVYDDGGTNGKRDKLGRIERKTETIGGVTTVHEYVYNPAGRLEEVWKDGIQSETYQYDTNGNRTHVNGTLVGTYDDQDRMTSYAHAGGTATYTYTAAGELTTKVDPSGTTSYDTDVLGNLMSVTLPGGTAVEYVIDGRDRRTGRKLNTTLTQGLLYGDQLNPVAELDGSNAMVSRFAYGLVRFGARDYDPATGRWTTKDLILFAGADANLYAYVVNDPVQFVDPTGEFFVLAGVGAVFGGVAQAAANLQAFQTGAITGSQYAQSIVFGMGVGALAALAPNIAASVIAGGIGSALNTGLNQTMTGCIDWVGIAQAGAVGGITGGFAGATQYAGSNVVRIPSSLFGPLQTFEVPGAAIGTAVGTYAGTL